MAGEGKTVRYTADQLREKIARGEDETDFARIDAMSEAQLEEAIASDPDWKDVPRDWPAGAEAVMPRTKAHVSLRLDADVLEYFKAAGPGYQTRINAVLRAYMEAFPVKEGS